MTNTVHYDALVPRSILRVAIVLAAALMLTLFAAQVARAQTFITLHTFTGYPSDGNTPQARLLRDSAGNLYGTTTLGGAYGAGTIFKLDPAGKETILFNFFKAQNKDYGYWPLGGLIQDQSGNLYGTAGYGGDHTCNQPYGCGTVFKLDPTGHLTVLHRFSEPDGAFPSGTLARDDAGSLYGARYGNSANTAGVFKLDTAGKLTVLLTGADIGGVILDGSGNLYGAAYFGPVFKLNVITGQLRTWNINATSGVIPDAAGNLYFGGGQVYCSQGASDDSDCGQIYKLDTAGRLTVLHTFFGGADGADLTDILTLDGAGNLYGVSSYGGWPFCNGPLLYGCGTVFKLDPAGNFTILHSFLGTTDGDQPPAGLIRDSAGNVYGTSAPYAAPGRGSIFEITATSQTTLNLRLTADPAQPTAGGSVTYTFAVWNRGPEVAAHEILTTLVPYPLGFASVTTSGTVGLSSCTHPSVGQSGSVVCKEGSRMRAGSTWTVHVTMQIPSSFCCTFPMEGIVSADSSNQKTASIVTTVAP